jgi:DNA polymerase III subunit epsilon
MLLFLDTETTGKWDFSHAWDWPSQPHIVQLAAYLARDDEECTHIESMNTLIRPEGWSSFPEALAVHGITDERAAVMGIPLREAMTRFASLCKSADEPPNTGRVIAHNIQFDTHLILASFARCGMDQQIREWGILRPFCTMRALTSRMNLPGRYPGKPKWPTLDEAYRYMFPGATPIGEMTDHSRHSAMGDLLATRNIFTEGRKRGWWK